MEGERGQWHDGPRAVEDIEGACAAQERARVAVGGCRRSQPAFGGSGIQSGVYVYGGGDIVGGTTGTNVVVGTGGASTTGGDNRGVYVDGNGSTINSSGGNVTVTGQGGGGSGSGSHNYGVLVSSFGTITSGGAGTVNVTGTGGSGSGSYNDGVLVIGRATSREGV